MERCHRYVVIPTRHCVNLSAAVYMVLYDRLVKQNPYVTIHDVLSENRSDLPDNDNLHNKMGIL
ncbi:MAG: hypothetical protein H8E55_08425 [Pelagibacterales bacterium]|nr:hypothetical protein [Pelagibacterales bacterium]